MPPANNSPNLPSDYINLRREFVDNLPMFPSEALKIFLYLLDRNLAQKHIRIGLSANELARHADVGRLSLRKWLVWLWQPKYMINDKWTHEIPYIIMEPNKNRWTIKINAHWIGEEPTPIPFTFDDTDETKLAKAEDEIARLEKQLRMKQAGERSGLSEVLKGEERDLIIEIERSRGVSLNQIESWLLGKAIAKFGVERVKASYRKMQSTKNPIRALYASLHNGSMGQGMQPLEEIRKVVYRDLDSNVSS